MKYISKIIFILSCLSITNGKCAVTKWSDHFGSKNYEWGTCVQPTVDGGYISLAILSYPDSAFSNDLYIVKTNMNGLKIWEKIVNTGHNEEGYSIKQTSDMGFIIAGSSDTMGNNGQILILKIDSIGNFQWQKVLGYSNYDIAYDVIQADNGDYLFTGCLRNPSTDSLVIGRLDLLGNIMWLKTYGYAAGKSLQQTNDGGFIISGRGGGNYYLIKTNQNGDTLWTKQYNDIYWDGAEAVQQTNDGGYIIGGTKNTQYIYLLKTDSLGNMLWNKSFNVNPSFTYNAHTLQKTSDGGFIISGYSKPCWAFCPQSAYILKTDSLGNFQWDQTYDGLDAYYVKQTNDGGYIVASSISLNTLRNDTIYLFDTEVYLIKTDDLGNSIFNHDIVLCSPVSIVLASNLGYWGSHFNWSTGDTTENISYYFNLPSTTINLSTYNDSLSTGSTSVTVMVNPLDTNCIALTSPDIVNNPAIFKAYPNPATDQIEISVSTLLQNASLKIINATGKIIFEEEENLKGKDFHKTINLTNFLDGIYLLTFQTNNKLFTKKIIIIR